jgi:amino acid transporter
MSALFASLLGGRTTASEPRPRSKTSKESSGPLLNQWYATAVCGCNITSSCLYVISLCAEHAGKYSPAVLLSIGILLYLFRAIYVEVVTALPTNGGTYNLLKVVRGRNAAAVAGCLTMLSYVTTAVISSSSAVSYFDRTLDAVDIQLDQDVLRALPFCVITFAAVMNLIGISQSAFVAFGIFSFHLVTMACLVLSSAFTAFTAMPVSYNGVHQLAAAANATAAASGINATAVSQAMPMLEHNWLRTSPPMGLALGLFFGFGSGLLGVSGFESSSNFVESQRPGVFPKTLRNMWIIVFFLNPVLSVLSMCLLPMDVIVEQAKVGALLSLMADVSAGGFPLRLLVGLDAAVVLCGATLSAFVGFTGLCHRMATDGCMPPVLARRNGWTGSRHWAIIGYWFLTCTMGVFCSGDLDIMGGIYTIAFLSVMSCFALGNMLLKRHPARLSLPQAPDPASWPAVMVGFVGVAAGLVANLISRGAPALLGFFAFSLFFLLIVWLTRVCPVMQMGGEQEEEEEAGEEAEGRVAVPTERGIAVRMESGLCGEEHREDPAGVYARVASTVSYLGRLRSSQSYWAMD